MTTMPRPQALLDAQPSRLDDLQILRGIAAMLVVLDHAILAVIPYDPRFAPLLNLAGTTGKMGVNIFFIISGFIMMHTTEPVKGLPPRSRLRHFAWKRASRLVPLYWLATIFMILLGLGTSVHYTPQHVLTSFAFLPHFEDSTDPRMIPIVGVGWTITYEMLFYAIFGLSLLLPRVFGPLVCIAAIALMVAAGTIGLHHVQGAELRRLIAFYSYKNMLFFAVGILLAMGLRLIPRVGGPLNLPAQLLLIACALSAYRLLGFQDGGKAWETISFLTCCVVVTLAIAGPRTDALPGRRLLLHVGDASFSTYLFHAPLMHGLAQLSAALLVRGWGGPFIVVAGLICLAMGSLVHLGIELPLTRLVREGGARWKAA
ncbi:acyltransferase family protein [Sphingomonas sp. PR090111-T3T-6A]|uniref:acyltransferase family protein n=1 Tax=Sphingomonas sp. PR090111-T3T-6A TaxID=685778 RepID=UPI00036EC6D1|nr:acyltransferase [Sphingomonas sp. PR090111-T3T-6A]